MVDTPASSPFLAVTRSTVKQLSWCQRKAKDVIMFSILRALHAVEKEQRENEERRRAPLPTLAHRRRGKR